jgi:hypothetical protein
MAALLFHTSSGTYASGSEFGSSAILREAEHALSVIPRGNLLGMARMLPSASGVWQRAIVSPDGEAIIADGAEYLLLDWEGS